MPASRMETWEGITVREVCCYVSGESSPLSPPMPLMLSDCALGAVPVRQHQLAACLGLPSQERWDERWEEVEVGERHLLGPGQERRFSQGRSISEPLQSRKKLRLILHFSSSINTLTSHHVDAVSHCNLISYPELQIDHSAHTGDG